MESSYDILGQIDREVATGVGFDASLIIDAASEIAKRGVSAYQEKKAGEASAKEVDAQAARVIAADVNLVDALASVEIAQAGKNDAGVAAARFAVEQARATADAASAGITPAVRERRVKAAQDLAEKTAAAWRAAPKSVTDAARARAAREVAALAAAAGGPLPSGGVTSPPTAPSSQEGFLQKIRWGRPTWQWGAGGLGLAAALALALRFLLKRKG